MNRPSPRQFYRDPVSGQIYDVDPTPQIGGLVNPNELESLLGSQSSHLEVRNGAPQNPQERPFADIPGTQRGATVIFQSGPGVSAPIAPLNIIQARGSGQDGEMATIVLGCTNSDPTNTAAILASHLCVLEWGLGGATFSATIDFRVGTMLTIPATYVSVNVIPSNNNVGPVTTWMFSAAVAYGTVPARRNRVTNTVSLASIADSASITNIPIPAFATSMNFYAGDNTVAPLVGPVMLTQYGSLAANSYFGTFAWAGNSLQYNQNTDAIPIMAGARFVKVLNKSGSTVNIPSLVFDIAI